MSKRMTGENTKPSKSTSKLADIFFKASMWVLVSGVIVLFAYACYLRAINGEQDKKEFSGKIIDKFTISHESKTGSSFTRYIEMEEKTGARRKIAVSEEIYQKAEPGMRIDMKQSGISLFEPENDG